MEDRRTIRKNMLMSVILTVSNYVFPLLTYSYVTRILLAEGTGKVAFVRNILSYFMYIAALGIGGYGMRECAKVRGDRDRLSRLTTELLTINMISTVIAYFAFAAFFFLVPKFHDYMVLFAVMCPDILLQTLGMEWLYRGMEEYTYITVRSILFKSMAVALTFCLVRDAGDVVWYGAITIFTASASNLLNFFHARKYIDWKKVEGKHLKRHLKPVMVFFFSTIIIAIYGHFDTTMLGFMKGDGVVGIYNAGLRMNALVLSVSTAVTSVFIPRMSRYYADGEQARFLGLLVKSFRITLVLMFPLCVFVILNAPDVLCFVCGEEFLSATPTLVILMICALVLAVTNLLGNQVLVPKNMEKRYSQSVFIGMFINLGLDMLLIPRFSSAGAAFATLVTESFNVFWMGCGCKGEIRYISRSISFRKYFLPMLCAVAAGICINVFSGMAGIGAGFGGTMGSLLRLLPCGAAFFGVYYLILMLGKEPVVEEGKALVVRKIRGVAGRSD